MMERCGAGFLRSGLGDAEAATVRTRPRLASMTSTSRILSSVLPLALVLLAGPVAPSASTRSSVALATPPVPPEARGATALDGDGPRVEVRLVVEHSEILHGEGFRAGLLFDIDPGWHIYGRDPGPAGLATEIEWSLDNAEIDPTGWPEPEVFRDSAADGGKAIETFGYSGQVLLATRIVPLATFDGAIRLTSKARFIACKVICVPGQVDLERTLMLGAGKLPGEAPTSALTALFDHYQARVVAADDPRFRSQASMGDNSSPARTRTTRSIGLLHAFLLALLGGLILNAMPCVLPVLAIKTVGLAEIARESRRRVAAHGLVYTAGILCSMWLLAGAVLGLRQAGLAVGWGFQFQEPLFLAGISIVLLLFALNLFGIWEITPSFSRLSTLGNESKGLRRSFFDGFLVVTLATPCSAPFLGTAVGFAFAGGPLEIGVIFSSIGLGLAIPFALISFVPSWARWMPRSGPWMARLRASLGFALLATMVWILWLLGGAGGNDLLGLVLALLVAVALAAWVLGQLQLAGRVAGVRLALAGIGVAVVAAISALSLVPAPNRSDASALGGASGALEWRAFDRSRIAADLEDQRAVFVYFTADWCVTCKLNESLVLESDRVVSELARLDFATYRGDWTLRDPIIRDELQRFGKAGVPVYLVYGPGRPHDDPLILPEVLTIERMLNALREAAKRPGSERV